MSVPSYASLAALAMTAAQAGAAAASRWCPTAARPPVTVETKGDASPVTVADRDSEAAIRQVIALARPGDSWLGEETGRADVLVPGSVPTPFRWIVDPIDGTRNFVRGIPFWSVLVGVAHVQPDQREVMCAAAVVVPGQQESYEAWLGGGARCNGVSIRVSSLTSLDQALFCYETPAWFRNNGLGPAFERLLAGTALSRGLCDAYGHMLVASGRADVVVEPHLSVWDVAATSLIVNEAGGQFSDLSGSPSIHSGNAVVSNRHLHNAVLNLVHQS